MLSYTIIILAILLGYATTVLTSFVLTMGIAAGAPGFVALD